ncbi:MAG: DUF1801 domain-containing protein [Flavobacteriales bacterium]|nr:DUF1801 domain-containing protein [Flavobacteriales bacterium]
MDQTVTQQLDALNHPLRSEIEALRRLILSTVDGLTENFKWNGPNYTHHDDDRITMKIHPPKQIQLIFHRGAKKLEQPADKLISSGRDLLSWRGNDRAIASFKSLEEIEQNESELRQIVADWIAVTH